MRIYKYALSQPVNSLFLPSGAKILSCGLQGENIKLWALVDTIEKVEERIIEIFPTGYKDVDNATRRFIGTVITPELMVWHIFERLKEQD